MYGPPYTMFELGVLQEGPVKASLTATEGVMAPQVHYILLLQFAPTTQILTCLPLVSVSLHILLQSSILAQSLKTLPFSLQLKIYM
ncbi:unnamed protein product [Pleuronectes platessa]|uniref:Uncharacterized protein n=1 Tax=Pleuronectes platessa TaxID=8262 RepID=A0A9N7ZA96_PLEPL|nr:unnamed protein product [Pleuronectes platessa]